MKNKILFVLFVFAILLFGILSFVFAIPLISFTSTTPADNLWTRNTSVEINVSIDEANLGSLIYNWNGTNYTFYNNSLVLMMNFENKSSIGENSTYAVDVSKYGNNGTIYGAVINSSSGKYGWGGYFDGVNDYVSISDSSNFDFGTGGFSIGMWFKKIGEGRGDIFNWKDGNGIQDDFGFILQDDETFDVWFKIDGTGDYAVTNGHSFSINQWHQAVFVRNSTGNITTYIDGVPDGSGSSNMNLSNINAGTPIWIGSNKADGSPANIFNGAIGVIEIKEFG